MEKVTIQEASRRLNLSQAAIRESIRNGDLKATREPSPSGRRWMVEMPEDGWEHGFTSSLRNLAQSMTPWWWSNAQNTGFVHYVQDLGIEEIEPLYLCGLKGDNVWDAAGHTLEQRCPECADIAKERDLPHS